MGRAPCCDKANVKRGPWSPEEDAKLKDYIEKFGTGGNWIALPQKVGLKRCGKSCRLRWLNYLRPNIKHGGFTDYEDNLICSLYATIGSRWSIMAAQLPGRTDNDIKNYWNTKLKKKFLGWYQAKLPQSSLLIPSTLSYQIMPPNGNYSSYGNTNNDALSQSQICFSQTNNYQDYKVTDSSSIHGGEVSTSSTSEGSCSNTVSGKERVFRAYGDEMMPHGYEHNLGLVEDDRVVTNANGFGALDEWNEEQKAGWGEHFPEFGLEGIEQLISTSSRSNFIFDENQQVYV